jgi:hypothetical protein
MYTCMYGYFFVCSSIPDSPSDCNKPWICMYAYVCVRVNVFVCEYGGSSVFVCMCMHKTCMHKIHINTYLIIFDTIHKYATIGHPSFDQRTTRYIHTYIHTSLHSTLLTSMLPSAILNFTSAPQDTYIHAYIPHYIRYIHTYIHTSLYSTLFTSMLPSALLNLTSAPQASPGLRGTAMEFTSRECLYCVCMYVFMYEYM